MRKITALIFIIVSFSFKSSHESTWEMVKMENNIYVYTRFGKTSPIKEIKITVKINAPIQRILRIIQDVHGYTEWVYLCKEAKTVEKISQNEQIYYTVTNSPWPVQDRDAVIHGKTIINESTNEITIISESYSNIIPESEEYLRIKNIYAKWKLIPVNSESVWVEYYLSLDPGGNIPAWLINYSIYYGPFYTINSLIEIAENNSNL